VADAVRDAEYVQECGPENLATNSPRSRNLTRPHTSTISLRRTSAIVACFLPKTAGRARCLVAQSGQIRRTSFPWSNCAASLDGAGDHQRARKILSDIGQAADRVKREIDGFVLNRPGNRAADRSVQAGAGGLLTPRIWTHASPMALASRGSFMDR